MKDKFVANCERKVLMEFNKNKGFTLAEVLITLAIIGVVAAISIPSVISNSQQQEFKTGLRKAVSVLNSAITMNMALDGESPYDNANTYGYLQKHMAIMKSTTIMPYYYTWTPSNGAAGGGGSNAVFYTTDGMRFEMEDYCGGSHCDRGPKLHESGVETCIPSAYVHGNGYFPCGGCGSYGLNNNKNNTTKVPCHILVDVNGDRKPTPANVNCKSSACQSLNKYVYPQPDARKLTDIFGIMITEDRAVPFGVAAQKAMYEAREK